MTILGIRLHHVVLFGIAGFLINGVAPCGASVSPLRSGRDFNVNTSEGVAGLPFAKGARFKTLDEYLAYRQKLGTLDRPYYEEISPGIYQLVGRRAPGEAVKTFTRQQLLEKFGFGPRRVDH